MDKDDEREGFPSPDDDPAWYAKNYTEITKPGDKARTFVKRAGGYIALPLSIAIHRVAGKDAFFEQIR